MEIQIGDIVITKNNEVLGFVSKIETKNVYFNENILYTKLENVSKILRKIDGIWQELEYQNV